MKFRVTPKADLPVLPLLASEPPRIMLKPSRQRSCLPCSHGKRQCDAAKPTCSRCIRYKKVCKYGVRKVSTLNSTKHEESSRDVISPTAKFNTHGSDIRVQEVQVNGWMGKGSLDRPATLFGLRFSENGEIFDVERVLLGGPMSVVQIRE